MLDDAKLTRDWPDCEEKLDEASRQAHIAIYTGMPCKRYPTRSGTAFWRFSGRIAPTFFASGGSAQPRFGLAEVE